MQLMIRQPNAISDARHREAFAEGKPDASLFRPEETEPIGGVLTFESILTPVHQLESLRCPMIR